MKKMVSLVLSLMMVLSAAGMITAGAADVTTSFKDDTSFYFSFENESDFDHPDMVLDTSGSSTFKTPGVTRYCEGAYGSKGAVAAHIEVTAGQDGIANEGVSNIELIPGQEYELSMDLKLFSPENFAKLPNVNVFFMVSDTSTMYADPEGTAPATASYYYTVYKIPGADVFQFEEDGTTVSGDWAHLNYKFTATNKYSSGYVKNGETAKVYMFVRFGASEHGIVNNGDDFTEAFKESCETINAPGQKHDGKKALWIEYAIDNVGLRPASAVSEEPAEEDSALWRASFEDSNWANETEGVALHTSYAKTALVDDVPDEIADTSSKALELTYTGWTGNGGYTELVANVTDNNKKMWYNRAYEVSFWAKGTQEVVDYYSENPNQGLLIIPERNNGKRLERTRAMWADYKLKDAITTEWTKYTYLYYEELPASLGRDGENTWETKFDLRFTCVPSMEKDSPEAEAYKIYLDDFTVTPLDIVYNGDLAVTEESQVDYGTVTYNGTTDTSATTAMGTDTTSPAIFHNGAIDTVTDFPGADSKNVLKVTKEGGTPYQGVDIENGKTYEISFWAKADDVDSAGQPINVVLDRDIQGQILDDTEPTYEDVPKWASYSIDTTDTKDITLNTAGYDGYGAPTEETGSIPFYLYGGVLANTYHNPFELKPTNYEETLVYDDYYDRMFTKNTQEGQEPTAWGYQYFDGTDWVGTNDKADITSGETLSEEWTQYTIEYTWDYPGMHYRMPKLTFLDNANYSLADIKIEEIEVEDSDAESAFHVENLTATGKDVLTTTDSISLTWDVVTTAGPEAIEADGGSLVKVYADNNGEFALIGAARADKAGETEIAASADMFGKDLVFEVIPVDTKGTYGTGATTAFSGKVAMSVVSELSLNLDKVSADWSVDVLTAEGISGTANVYVAMYDDNGKLVDVEQKPLAYAAGTTTTDSGNVEIPSAADKVKLFVWDEALKPMSAEKEFDLMSANSNPFAGDSEINVVFLGDSIYQGSGASSVENRWVTKVGNWFDSTYEKNGVTVNWYNKGVGGTTTDYSLVRVMRDVVAYDPDVVFFSHTCNDGNRDTRRNMESVVRTLMELDNPPYIIFTRTTNESYSVSNGYGNQVADFYSLPLIDDLEAFRAATAGTGVTMADLFDDGTHPNDAGYQVIADEIIRCLETGRYYHKPVYREDKLVANSGAIAEATWFSSTDTSKVKREGSWTTGGNYVQSSQSGDTLTFTFTGDIMAFEYGLHKDSGLIEVWVDDELKATCDPRYNDTLDSYQLVCKENSLLLDLEYGEHEVVMKTAPNPKVTGAQVDRIFNIMTGSWVQE